MAVDFSEIFDGLSQYDPEVLNQKDTPSIIKSVVFLDGQISEFQEEILYVGSTLQLSHGPCLAGANLVLYGNTIDIPEIEAGEANIIFIHGECKPESLFNALYTIMTSSLDVANHALALLQTMLQGRGLIDIIEMGARILNRLVFLTDSGFKILARSMSKPSDEMELNYFLELGYLPWQIVDPLKKLGILDRLAREPRPVFIRSWVNEDKERMIGKVEADGKILAYVILLGHGRPFSDQDVELVALMCKMIGAEMRKGNYHGNTQNLMHENLMLDLLGKCITREEVAMERARTADFPVGSTHSVLCIDVHRNQTNAPLVDYVRQESEVRFPGAKTLIYKKHLILMIGIKDGKVLDRESYERIEAFLEKNNVTAGMSLPFKGLTPLADHYEQAARALELAVIFEDSGALFLYENYKTYDLLSAVSERKNLLDFCHPAIMVLLENDQKGHYLDSLWTYLNCQQNLVQTAGRQSIHRNTLVYRLNRIKELTDLDLNDSETVFQLQLSQRILRFVEQLEGNKGVSE